MGTFRYRCFDCGREFGRDEVRYLCPDCGDRYKAGEPLKGVLEAIFDYEAIKTQLDPRHLDWSLLCAVEKQFHPPFPVGNTPLVWSNRLAELLGLKAVGVKFDGLNPSGSLKDRASFLVVAEALRLGERKIAVASTGNAASSLAAVCAAAGLEAVIFVPTTAPKAKLAQMILCGAQVITVNGTYDDAFKMSLRYTKEKGGLNRNTAYHPLTIEGKKSVAFEIYEQNGFKAPGAIFVPVGDGVIISSVYKGFYDLQRCGLIEKVPRLIAVQAVSSAAIHRLITKGKYADAPAPRTIADSISVSTPSNAFMAARRVKESGGFSVTVSDAEIMKAQKLLAAKTGIFAEPAAAAPLAGLMKTDRKLLKKAGNVVLLVTGHGLKDVDAAFKGTKLPDWMEPD
ncbi:MAG: threonine synthase [Planctomycetota bacterium]|nr:threonine synthase [Planctomycetota bacterium]